jgi:hypothetical protein
MKKYIILLLLCLGVSIANWSCSSDEDKNDPELIVSTDNLAFTKDGGDNTIHIKTNQKWTVASSESWCTVLPASGEGTGTIKLTVSAQANTTTDVRNATLTITAGNIKKK